jgi:antitoxin (DNA-binding transcriptional repressor) of toxin-antitoxin stability system
MKTATVRELRNNYTALLRWIDAGEEISISRRGRVVARLVPASAKRARRVDWSDSAALRRDKSKLRCLSAEESAKLLEESRGDY